MIDLRILKNETALLVIDMQNGFVHPESQMGKSLSGTKEQQRIVPSIIRLVALCRKLSIPIIWTQQEHFVEDRTRIDRVILPHSTKQGFLPCLRGSWEVEFFEEIKNSIRPNDYLVQKHRASAFYNTNLEIKLRMLGTRFLLIAGCNTEFCIESTIRDGYARGFEIVVIRECVAGIKPEFHENSLKVIASYFGEVLSFEALESGLV